MCHDAAKSSRELPLFYHYRWQIVYSRDTIEKDSLQTDLLAAILEILKQIQILDYQSKSEWQQWEFSKQNPRWGKLQNNKMPK